MSVIHNADGKLAITPGVWWYDKGQLENEGFVIRDFGDMGIIACSFVDPDKEWMEESEANAALIAEAGTVTNATGRTPAELAAELAELKEEIRQARRQWIGDDAGHLPLADAIQFVRDREAAELLKERDDARKQMDEWRTNCLKIRERSEAQKAENERLAALVRELREALSALERVSGSGMMSDEPQRTKAREALTKSEGA
jgi:hypothetical protein